MLFLLMQCCCFCGLILDAVLYQSYAIAADAI
jgi:hypothetical protein